MDIIYYDSSITYDAKFTNSSVKKKRGRDETDDCDVNLNIDRKLDDRPLFLKKYRLSDAQDMMDGSHTPLSMTGKYDIYDQDSSRYTPSYETPYADPEMKYTNNFSRITPSLIDSPVSEPAAAPRPASSIVKDVKALSGYSNVRSLVKEPQALIFQANTYMENIFGSRQRISSRQAVIISHDNIYDKNHNNPTASRETHDSTDRDETKKGTSSYTLTRKEIYRQQLRKNMKSVSTDDGETDNDNDESFNELGGSTAIYLFYQFFWSFFVVFIALGILVLSFTQILVILPMLVLYHIFTRLKYAYSKQSIFVKGLLFAASVYYAHKFYFTFIDTE